MFMIHPSKRTRWSNEDDNPEPQDPRRRAGRHL
uniref:Uncharacterized protein n=1 Tax=Siphoviridae sp. ctMBu2 TaxID=2827853 RepID=A0A8S5T4Q6_9CAUD|nr:MAG TPA: hypothetical protein [Siphoviridae sp. ctMBu2]